MRVADSGGPHFVQEDQLQHIMNRLWIVFSLCCAPFATLLLIGWLVHYNDPASLLAEGTRRLTGIVIFLLTVIATVALPILVRVRFHDRAVKEKVATLESYIQVQKQQMLLIGIGSTMAGLAYLLVIPNLYLYGSVLSALYGIYSVLPSERKTAGELKAYGCRIEKCEAVT